MINLASKVNSASTDNNWPPVVFEQLNIWPPKVINDSAPSQMLFSATQENSTLWKISLAKFQPPQIDDDFDPPEMAEPSHNGWPLGVSREDMDRLQFPHGLVIFGHDSLYV